MTQPRHATDLLVPTLFGAAGLVAYLAPLGLAVLLPLLTLALLAGTGRKGAVETLLLACRPRLLWAIPLIGVLSALWAIDGGAAAREGGRLLLEIVCGTAALAALARLPAEERRRATLLLALSLIVAGCFTLADAALGGPLSQRLHGREMSDLNIANAFSRGAVFNAILEAPLLAALLRQRRYRLAALSLLVAVAAIFALRNDSAKLALLAGVVAALGAWFWHHLGRVLLVGVAALSLFLPFLLLAMPDPGTFCEMLESKSSAVHRLYIWQFVDHRILEKPVLGWGMDASRRLAGPDDVVTLRSCATPERPSAEISAVGLLPLHPHNGILQIWVELGGLGALIVAFLLCRDFWDPLSAAQPNLAAAAGGLAAAFLSASISFGIWQAWWISSFYLCAATVQLARTARD